MEFMYQGACDIIHCSNYRDLVMWLLADIAPGDSHQRRQHHLTRRVYHNKVSIIIYPKILRTQYVFPKGSQLCVAY